MRSLLVLSILICAIFTLLVPESNGAYITPCGRQGTDHNACARYCRSRPCPRNGLYQGVRAESGTCTFGACICHFNASRTRTC